MNYLYLKVKYFINPSSVTGRRMVPTHFGDYALIEKNKAPKFLNLLFLVISDVADRMKVVISWSDTIITFKLVALEKLLWSKFCKKPIFDFHISIIFRKKYSINAIFLDFESITNYQDFAFNLELHL